MSALDKAGLLYGLFALVWSARRLWQLWREATSEAERRQVWGGVFEPDDAFMDWDEDTDPGTEPDGVSRTNPWGVFN